MPARSVPYRIQGVPFVGLFLVVCLGLTGCVPALESIADETTEGNAHHVADPVSRYLSLPPPTPAEERAAIELLESAMDEWRDGDRLRGALQADSALARLPALGDWRPLILAELLAPTGDTTAVRAALDWLDPNDELWIRWGWEQLVVAHEESGDPIGAGREARAAAEITTDPGIVSLQWLRAGQLALEVGDTLRAREDLWNALLQGEDHSGARNAARVLDGLHETLEARDERILGRALLAAYAWGPAHRRLGHHLASEDLSDPDRMGLRLELGRALFELRRYSESEALLAPLISESVPARVREPALYWTGRAAFARGSISDAENAFRRLAQASSGASMAEEGFHLLLTRELETGFGPRAQRFLDELLSAGVGSASTELTVVQLGTTQYLNGEHTSAGRTFDRYREGSRRTVGRQQAGHWSALIEGRQGNDARARTLWTEVHHEDPLSFYGIIAGERVGAPVLPPQLATGPPPVPGLDVELQNALTRLRVHQLVPTPGSFAYELGRLTDHFFLRGDGAYDFAEAMIEGGLPLQGIVLGRDIHRLEGQWNLRLLRIVHPFPHRDIIVSESASRGLDPFFVAGLIRQESMFHTEIRSSAGAVGLMQLMPATAREVAGSLGMAYSLDRLSDPEFNVRLGTTFLAGIMLRFDGRIEDALSAYNAGPTRARQWQQRPTYRDRDVFIEHIPFQETRHYVKVVQQYTRIYTALYGCADFTPCLGLSYPDLLARSPFLEATPSRVSSGN